MWTHLSRWFADTPVELHHTRWLCGQGKSVLATGAFWVGTMVTADQQGSTPSRCTPPRSSCRQYMPHGRDNGHWHRLPAIRGSDHITLKVHPLGMDIIAALQGHSWASSISLAWVWKCRTAGRCTWKTHVFDPTLIFRPLGTRQGHRHRHFATRCSDRRFSEALPQVVLSASCSPDPPPLRVITPLIKT
jgi:hypothetical protein